MEAITIGLDIAKSVFQVHGVDGEGEVVVCRQLRRSQVIPFFKKLAPCLIGPLDFRSLQLVARWLGLMKRVLIRESAC